MEHLFDIIEDLVLSDALSLSDPCPDLVIRDRLVAELQEQILVAVLQHVLQLFTGEPVETVDELEVTCHWGQYTLDAQEDLELLVAQELQVTVQKKLVPIFMCQVKLRRIQVKSLLG